MSAHSPLAPSSAHIWGVCAGHVAAVSGLPNYGSQETEEGTAAHWCWAEVLTAWKTNAIAPLDCYQLVGHKAPNGVMIDDDIAECAQMFVDWAIETVQRNHAMLSEIRVEQSVEMSRIHPECWGTPDLVIPVPAARVLIVADYKHGHRMVSPVMSEQLGLYTEGVLAQFPPGTFDQVMLAIVQPRCYQATGPVQTWWTTPQQLASGLWGRLYAKAHEARGTAPTCTTGEHCRDCAAVRDCRVARGRDYKLIDLAEQPLQLDRMRPSDLAVEREMMRTGIKAAQARLEAIEQQLIHEVGQGATDCPYILQTGRARYKFSAPDGQVIAMAKLFGGEAATLKLRTPKQVEDSVPKALRFAYSQAAEHLIEKVPGALSLVEKENSRVAAAFRRV